MITWGIDPERHIVKSSPTSPCPLHYSVSQNIWFYRGRMTPSPPWPNLCWLIGYVQHASSYVPGALGHRWWTWCIADKPAIGMGTNGGALSGHQEPINRTPGDHAHSHTRINREKPHSCNRVYICICIYTYINVWLYLYIYICVC